MHSREGMLSEIKEENKKEWMIIRENWFWKFVQWGRSIGPITMQSEEQENNGTCICEKRDNSKKRKKKKKGGFCFTKELHFLSSSRLAVWMNARESAPWARQSVALLQIVGEGSRAKLHWSTPPYAALNNSTPLFAALHLSVPQNTNQKWSVYHSIPLL